MAKHVVEHEPGFALFVHDEHPLIFYERIIQFAASHLSQGGKIYFEIHELRSNAISHLASRHQWQAAFKKDMQGKDRMVCMQRNGVT
jgi:release factor glutamine methyltransferase